MTPETTEIQIESSSLTRAANQLVVIDAASHEVACEFLRHVKALLGKIADTFDGPIKAAHAAHKSIIAARDRHAKPLEEAERQVKGRIGSWRAAEERKRAEAERAAREQARREAEERQVAEAAERMKAAEVARTAGLAETAAKLDGDAAAILAQPPIVSPIVAQVSPPVRSEGVASRLRWTFRILDAAALPREYLVPNLPLIGAAVRAQRHLCRIPGIEVVQEVDITVRGQ